MGACGTRSILPDRIPGVDVRNLDLVAALQYEGAPSTGDSKSPRHAPGPGRLSLCCPSESAAICVHPVRREGPWDGLQGPEQAAPAGTA